MARTIDDNITVNDGKGLFDTSGFIDSLVVDCNELPKLLISGHGVGFCAKVVEMVQKLSTLKKGVEDEKNAYRQQIATLTQENENITAQLMQKGES